MTLYFKRKRLNREGNEETIMTENTSLDKVIRSGVI